MLLNSKGNYQISNNVHSGLNHRRGGWICKINSCLVCVRSHKSQSISPIVSWCVQLLWPLLPGRGVMCCSVVIFSFLFPSGAQAKACRLRLSTGLRRVWQIHFQCLCRISCSTGIWHVLSLWWSLWSFKYLLRKAKKRHRHLYWKSRSCFSGKGVDFQMFLSWRMATLPCRSWL